METRSFRNTLKTGLNGSENSRQIKYAISLLENMETILNALTTTQPSLAWDTRTQNLLNNLGEKVTSTLETLQRLQPNTSPVMLRKNLLTPIQ